MNNNFVHLHNHTEFSMLDGAARINDLFKKVKSLNMPAVAVTDHGNMFNAYEFWKTGKLNNVKPIIGIEAYLSPDTHRSYKKPVKWGGENSQPGDDVSGAGAYTHMTMWAENTSGMHNLFRLSTKSYTEGFYYKPRIDKELLQKYGNGIIATTGCPSGEIQTKLRLGQYESAKKAAGDFQDIFGKDNFFCELMLHDIEIERRVQTELISLAKELNIPLVATNDLHYVEKKDSKAHAALLCVQSASTLNDPKRFKFSGDSYYLKSSLEMNTLFKDIPEACKNTLVIAERCNVEFNEKSNYMPAFKVPFGESENSWFIKKVEEGLKYRYKENITDKVRQRVNYEVDIITQMGFISYFLIVADFINWAKGKGIKVGPGRGSGAGSMVAYVMRITDLDPLEHGLIFERFLNPNRISMPDFDVDFDDRRRSEVIQYVAEKYGSEHVAQIVTYGTIKSKQALRDSARVLGYPFSFGDTLIKAMPETIMGKDIPLSEIYEKKNKRYKEAEEFRRVVESDNSLKEVFETACGLEGLKRQWGVHAAGVIMSSEPLKDIIPLMKRDQDSQIITQFDYPSCESLGLVKMDFLGLRNLTTIDDALTNIKKNTGKDINLEDLQFNDKKSYELLARGDTLGVFQLDGGPMRSLLKMMRPDSFEDISAVIALYRPGPMGANSHTNYALRKNKQQKIEPIHPELKAPLEKILDTTYGLIVYQEQVMEIAQKVAGYSLGQADILRRAMGKKNKAELNKQYAEFRKGMEKNQYSNDAIKTLWSILIPFSDYAFNKAHAAAYGVISYWTAYLKANYPVEYMASLLTSVGNDQDKMALYLNECRRMGITVLTPDVNESSIYFSAIGKYIRFGLAALRNLGLNQAEIIEKTHKEKGVFKNFKDFFMKVPSNVINKRTIYSLVHAGAFDSFGYKRSALNEIVEETIVSIQNIKKNESIGQYDLFDLIGKDIKSEVSSTIPIPDMPEWDKKVKLSKERDVLGMYVSDHPLKDLENILKKYSENKISDYLTLDKLKNKENVKIAGLIVSSLVRRSKINNQEYARLEIEDQSGSIEVMIFGKTYQSMALKLSVDNLVCIEGRIRQKDDGSNKSIIAKSINLITIDNDSEKLKNNNFKLTINIHKKDVDDNFVNSLIHVFKENPGKDNLYIKLYDNSKITLMKLPNEYSINKNNPNFITDIKALLGKNAFDTEEGL